jgi:ketosteroid isomerase-like protein
MDAERGTLADVPNRGCHEEAEDMASVMRTGTAVAAAGVDHVRLSYHYLDRGDVDGYASLLDSGAVLDLPGHGRVRGRGEVAKLRCARWRGAHHLRRVFTSGERVVALGRFSGAGRDGARVDVDFAHVFSLSEHGLLAGQRCYYFGHPPGWT